MEPYKLFDAEYKFTCLIWDNEPINSTDLVKLSQAVLGWKKSTTYTVLRKLCKRGVLKNEEATVTSIVKKEDAQKYESQMVVEKSFNGSLPQFLTAFLGGKGISNEEAEELKRIIEEATKS
ncbi:MULTISPECIES: BlaI/MecI/CopY family transcriptional regulator [unclassified Lysinibacillus]|uniref:BlaI/MecI/CopY family transcriptional regulator n=1 Tax=unclassified Lysinibacillus TaxID=2636778 RepID=UPI00200DA4D0|nr:MULTISPECIES: BlaI/MecI/CopY family transcriptional regulator [unclassified Lysinibacillus]MDD1505846.1 BlaI/MecI/CopY family transcriptional regulator [Lysinibacillus sp. CNPSo 3705]UPW81816.1 BlaI/MecI/CopY family transcriptional regulator [Lysinibacillus sp. Ag94]